ELLCHVTAPSAGNLSRGARYLTDTTGPSILLGAIDNVPPFRAAHALCSSREALCGVVSKGSIDLLSAVGEHRDALGRVHAAIQEAQNRRSPIRRHTLPHGRYRRLAPPV